MTTLTLQAGDLFCIKCTANALGYGQIIDINPVSPVYVLVFEPLWEPDDRPSLEMICSSPVLLAANTFDALVVNGSWPLISQFEFHVNEVMVPRFKVYQDGRWLVEGFFGDVRHEVSSEQERALPLRYVTSPMNLEDALKARHGLLEWRPSFDEMLYSKITKCGEPLSEARRRAKGRR